MSLFQSSCSCAYLSDDFIRSRSISKSGTTEEEKEFEDEEEKAVEINESIKIAGFGKFQYTLLITLGSALFSAATIQNIFSFSYQTIKCSKQLTEQDLIDANTIIYASMLYGFLIFSTFGDLYSRRTALLCAVLMNMVFCSLLNVFYEWIPYLFLRATIAACNTGIYILSVTIVSEFEVISTRGMMVATLYVFWIMGFNTAHVLELITENWEKSALFASIFFLISAILISIFIVKSPIFLFYRGKESEAMESLKYIFEYNKLSDDNTKFPIHSLARNKEFGIFYYQKITRTLRTFRTAILMAEQFLIMFSFYTLGIWFQNLVVWYEPLFEVDRYNLFNNLPKDCQPVPLLSEYVQDKILLKQQICLLNQTPYRNNPNNNILNSSITCIPVVLILILALDVYGRNFFIVLSHALASILIMVSYYLTEAIYHLCFATIFQSLCLISLISAQCSASDIFPTNTRCFGVGLVFFAGQLGAIAGNIGLALLITTSCVTLVLIFGILVNGSGLLILTTSDSTRLVLTD